MISNGIADRYAQFELEHDIARMVNINGKEVLIDKRFVNIIKELNRKGYQTLFCCSGHTVDESKLMAEWKYKTFSDTYRSIEEAYNTFGKGIYISFNEDTEPKVMPDFSYKYESSKDRFENFNRNCLNKLTYEEFVTKFGKKSIIRFNRPDLYDVENHGYHENDLMSITYQIADWVRSLPLIQYQ